MGLDMYLTAKKYLWRDGEDAKLSEDIGNALGIKANPENRFNGSSLMVKGVEVDAMYWRKANAIHGWFVDNCQEGEDDCKEYYVSRENLEELIQACEDELADPDSEDNPLQPRAGFFFGSVEKDEWYYQDLKATIEGLRNALSLPESFEFYYRSSW